ncbi:MBL fold metallo-hydrolase [Myxococcota bacterium]|nr:MBL fold metallo-hydrolase [Myxococcota bacterium]
MKCTFLGHSTLLLQSGVDAVLTDPLLTPRIMLKKRATAPGLALQDLPRLTAITISHAHTDHLHLPSLALLPRDCLLIVPSGVGRFVRRLGFSEVRELAWGESTTAGTFTITAIPVNHVRGRFFPWQDTGVNSYVLADAAHAFFAAGDIDFGPSPEMAQLADRFVLSAAALPVGGMREVTYYERRRGKKGVHIDPRTAWELFLQTGARMMVPIHWGVVRMAGTPVREPVEAVLEAARAHQMADRVRVLDPGEAWEL